MRWFGHALCHPRDTPVCCCEIVVNEGVKKDQGRPKITRKKVVSKDVQLFGINADLAKDRVLVENSF